MSVRSPRQARVEFLAPTHDDEGKIVHQSGEVITGELLARNHDFLLVRANTGAWMYLDTMRTDLYCIEMSDQV
jgi:hypothetical protein